MILAPARPPQRLSSDFLEESADRKDLVAKVLEGRHLLLEVIISTLRIEREREQVQPGSASSANSHEKKCASTNVDDDIINNFFPCLDSRFLLQHVKEAHKEDDGEGSCYKKRLI